MRTSVDARLRVSRQDSTSDHVLSGPIRPRDAVKPATHGEVSASTPQAGIHSPLLTVKAVQSNSTPSANRRGIKYRDTILFWNVKRAAKLRRISPRVRRFGGWRIPGASRLSLPDPPLFAIQRGGRARPQAGAATAPIPISRTGIRRAWRPCCRRPCANVVDQASQRRRIDGPTGGAWIGEAGSRRRRSPGSSHSADAGRQEKAHASFQRAPGGAPKLRSAARGISERFA